MPEFAQCFPKSFCEFNSGQNLELKKFFFLFSQSGKIWKFQAIFRKFNKIKVEYVIITIKLIQTIAPFKNSVILIKINVSASIGKFAIQKKSRKSAQNHLRSFLHLKDNWWVIYYLFKTYSKIRVQITVKSINFSLPKLRFLITEDFEVMLIWLGLNSVFVDF